MKCFFCHMTEQQRADMHYQWYKIGRIDICEDCAEGLYDMIESIKKYKDYRDGD